MGTLPGPSSGGPNAGGGGHPSQVFLGCWDGAQVSVLLSAPLLCWDGELEAVQEHQPPPHTQCLAQALNPSQNPPCLPWPYPGAPCHVPLLALGATACSPSHPHPIPIPPPSGAHSPSCARRWGLLPTPLPSRDVRPVPVPGGCRALPLTQALQLPGRESPAPQRRGGKEGSLPRVVSGLMWGEGWLPQGARPEPPSCQGWRC